MFNEDLILSVDDVERLLAAMKQHDRPAIVDWTNRVINVLSEVKQHPSGKIMSDGLPMMYQDYLFQLSHKIMQKACGSRLSVHPQPIRR